jgi:sulfide:quinone oxidoreductase
MPTIVIAGGGIAGLEALAALRTYLGSGVRIELLEAATDLVERQRAVTAPFGGGAPRRFDLARIAADHHAHVRADRLASVDADAGEVRTVGGDALAYDALLVAVGATPDVAIPGSLTFSGPRDVAAYTKMLEDLRDGRMSRVAFAVPTTATWALPLYELALMTAEDLQAAGRREVGLVIVTPEQSPLAAFGERIASHMWSLLAERAIAVEPDTVPLRAGPGGLLVAHGAAVQVECIVSLPRLGGPWVGGLPHDDEGFVPVDEHAAVKGVDGVWAAGDGTDFPIKQGGLAAQQADAAARAIAARLGADVAPTPFHPVLRGLLLDPRGRRFLDSTRGDMPATPLWWPPTKVAAPHLGRYLFPESPPAPAMAEQPVDVGQLLLNLASRHIATGELPTALRCLNAAAQVLGELPPDAAALRSELLAKVPG